MSESKTMEVLEWTGTRRMEVKSLPVPEARAGEVLVQVDSVGICGSELEAYLGVSPARQPPLVLGHELCGTVVDSQSCERDWKNGTPVAVYPILPCFDCDFCKSENVQLCRTRKLMSMHTPGAYAGYIAVDERMAFEIPPSLLGPAGSLVEPLATAVQSVKKGCLTPTGEAQVKTLVVVGAGPIGLLTVAYAAMKGVERIVAIDLVDSRLEIARRLGATDVLSSRGLSVEDVSNAVAEILGDHAESVIECVGLAVTRQMATACIAPLGKLVLVGLHTPVTELDFNHLIRSQVDCFASYASRFDDFEDAIEALASGMLADLDWIALYPLSEGDRAYSELVDRPQDLCKVVLRPHVG